VAVSRRRLWRSCRPKEWVRRLGALAADAHHCIMVGSLVHRIEGCGTIVRAPTCELPSDIVIPTHSSMPSCSEPSRTRPSGWRCAPSLTAPARAGHSDAWVGTKKRLPGRTKKLWDEKMDRTIGAPLDKIRPIEGVSLVPGADMAAPQELS
jgi:hypothetical protein